MAKGPSVSRVRGTRAKRPVEREEGWVGGRSCAR